MDSSLCDLNSKGNLQTASDAYNPDKEFDKVIHFTPYIKDMELQKGFDEWSVEIYGYELNKRKPYTLISSFFKILKKMKQEKVTIVRGRLPYPGSLYGSLAAKILRIPSVVSLGGDNRIAQDLTGVYHYKWRFLTNAIEVLTLKLCDAIIVPNRFTAKYVETLIGERSVRQKVSVIPWQCEEIKGEYPGDQAVIDQLNLPSDVVIVPIIGFINEYKFSDVLYKALLDWKPSNSDKTVFLFLGDGALRSEGEKLFSDRVDIKFMGWQPREVIHAILRRAGLVLVPMSGFVLLEAASIGKPVITSRVEWHSELVEDTKTGLLVDPTSPQEWRDAIERMLGDPDLAERMADALGTEFLRGYTPDRAKRLELELYNSLIET